MPLRHAIFRQPTPEELELHLRRAELAALRSTLAAREQSLAHLRDQLFSFEARYIRQVGVLYRQLDEWEERIAELKVSRESPKDRSHHLRNSAQNPAPDPDPGPPPPEPSPNLKALFRELAKRIHPDFATTPRDALHRTRLMAQANEAYRRDDAALLHRMLEGHDPNHPSHPQSIAAELLRVLAQTARIRAAIAHVDHEFLTLTQSEMALLREATILAALKHRDLLAELAARVKGRIGIVMRRFELNSSPNRRPSAAPDPDSLLTAELHHAPPPTTHRPR
jgi:hypothetical protein